MKACPTRLQLEAAVLGETAEARLVDLENHAEGCARCRHELAWLRTESAMFAQRAAREEVSRLWESVDARPDSKRGRGLARAVLAIAASVLLAVVAGRLGVSSRGMSRQSAEPVPMSLEMMSVDFGGPSSDAVQSEPCFTPGFGIACGEVQYASR